MLCHSNFCFVLEEKEWSYWYWLTPHPSESIGLVVGRVYSIILCSDFSIVALKLYFNSTPDLLSNFVGKSQFFPMSLFATKSSSLWYMTLDCRSPHNMCKREKKYVSHQFTSITISATTILQIWEICEKKKSITNSFNVQKLILCSYVLNIWNKNCWGQFLESFTNPNIHPEGCSSGSQGEVPVCLWDEELKSRSQKIYFGKSSLIMYFISLIDGCL